MNDLVPIQDSPGTLKPSLTDAQSRDRQWAAEFLQHFVSRPNSYSLYSRELRRLLWWLDTTGQDLKRLDHNSLVAYKTFLRSPPAEWCGPKRPVGHPEYRPFVSTLKESSVTTAMSVVGSFLKHLSDIEHLDKAPAFPKSHERTSRSPTLSNKVLSTQAIQALYHQADADPDPFHRSRKRLLVRLFYRTACRISDPITSKMGDFRQKEEVDGITRWKWHVIGKGNKHAELPLHDEVVEALFEWRIAQGLTPQPVPYERTPLFPGDEGSCNRTTLWRALRELFVLAASASDSEAVKQTLSRATPHGIRHTALTHLVQCGWPIEQVKVLARHSNIATTNIYVHFAGEGSESPFARYKSKTFA